jgi:hypothetical protein
MTDDAYARLFAEMDPDTVRAFLAGELTIVGIESVDFDEEVLEVRREARLVPPSAPVEPDPPSAA